VSPAPNRGCIGPATEPRFDRATFQTPPNRPVSDFLNPIAQERVRTTPSSNWSDWNTHATLRL
jgi:hypothetical protein